jgi:hypothetical protein
MPSRSRCPGRERHRGATHRGCIEGSQQDLRRVATEKACTTQIKGPFPLRVPARSDAIQPGSLPLFNLKIFSRNLEITLVMLTRPLYNPRGDRDKTFSLDHWPGVGDFCFSGREKPCWCSRRKLENDDRHPAIGVPTRRGSSRHLPSPALSRVRFDGPRGLGPRQRTYQWVSSRFRISIKLWEGRQ